MVKNSVTHVVPCKKNVLFSRDVISVDLTAEFNSMLKRIWGNKITVINKILRMSISIIVPLHHTPITISKMKKDTIYMNRDDDATTC